MASIAMLAMLVISRGYPKRHPRSPGPRACWKSQWQRSPDKFHHKGKGSLGRYMLHHQCYPQLMVILIVYIVLH